MTELQSVALSERPEHVPEALVLDFDLFNVPGIEDDIQAAHMHLHQRGPEIFWTPRNRGHWVVTRGEDIVHIHRNPAIFSSSVVSLPPMPPRSGKEISLEIDPPLHAQYRRPLMQALTPKAVQQLDDDVRRIVIAQIESLTPQGGCEFIKEFADILPIHLFLELVDLPREDKHILMPMSEIAVRNPDLQLREQNIRDISAYLDKWVTTRSESPGSDLLSVIVNVEVNGERICQAEAFRYTSTLLFGGLDTVASMIGLFAKFLAEHPDHRQQIIEHLEDDAFMKAAIDEMLRRHGIAGPARVVTEDLVYKDAQFKRDDHVLPLNLLVGLDDRLNPDPLTVDFSRKKPVHTTFGNGAQACPGAVLARRELRIFLDEWLRRIPDFRVKPGTKPKLVAGMTHGIQELHLVWP